MKKIFLFLFMAVAIGSSVGLFAFTQNERRADMAYCSLADLQAAYGEDRIAGWSRLNPDTVDRAIVDAGAEIDGYRGNYVAELSGGYDVPLAGAPANIKKYCIDIASANLVLSAGVLESDPGGKAVLEQAKIARAYLTKVAEGKFTVPIADEESGAAVAQPSGFVRAWSREKLDLKGY